MSDDPWAGKPSAAGRCDPKEPLPKLDPLAFVTLARTLGGMVKPLADPVIDAAKSTVAERERERQQRSEQMVREAVERKRKENVANGYPPDGPSQGGLGTPKPAWDVAGMRDRAAFLAAQLRAEQTAGNYKEAARIAHELATIEYHLDMATGGGSQQGGNNNNNANNTGTVADEKKNKPNPDGLTNERPGGAPLEPPPQNRRGPPINVPTPPAGGGRPFFPGGPRGPGGGPYRTGGR